MVRLPTDTRRNERTKRKLLGLRWYQSRLRCQEQAMCGAFLTSQTVLVRVSQEQLSWRPLASLRVRLTPQKCPFEDAVCNMSLLKFFELIENSLQS